MPDMEMESLRGCRIFGMGSRKGGFGRTLRPPLITGLNDIDRKVITVFMSTFSGSRNLHMAIILCQPLFFKMAATFYEVLLHYLRA